MRTRIITAAMLAALVGTGPTFADPPVSISPTTGSLPVNLLPDTQPDSKPALPPSADGKHVDPVATPSAIFTAPPDDLRGPKFWVDADYALYWVSPGRYPLPFLTTSPVPSLGVLGQANTQVVAGSDANYGTTNGFRLYSGGWWNSDHTIGSDGEAVYLEERVVRFTAASDGSSLLARPFVNALNGSQAAEIVAFPGFASGSLALDSRERFSTGDSNILINIARDDRTIINGLVGFRYVYFREQITATENQTFLADGFGMFLGNPLPAGTSMTISDRFETVNNLYLVQLGVNGETTRGPVTLSGYAKLGLGYADERTFVDGRTTVGGVTVPGGFLAQTTTPYRSYNDQFVVVPEFGGQFGYQIGKHWRITGGYNLFYVSSVARPGIQINPSINPNIVPSAQQFGTAGGPAQPTLQRNTTDLLAHGVDFGITYRY